MCEPLNFVAVKSEVCSDYEDETNETVIDDDLQYLKQENIKTEEEEESGYETITLEKHEVFMNIKQESSDSCVNEELIVKEDNRTLNCNVYQCDKSEATSDVITGDDCVPLRKSRSVLKQYLPAKRDVNKRVLLTCSEQSEKNENDISETHQTEKFDLASSSDTLPTVETCNLASNCETSDTDASNLANTSGETSNKCETAHVPKSEQCRKCHFCGKYFSGNYKVHLLAHNVEQSHKCTVCGKLFLHEATLAKHFQVHSVKKAFKCPICETYFAKKYNLKQHLLCHGSEKLHECGICGRSYVHKNSLNRHIVKAFGEKLHSLAIRNGEGVACQICGQVCTNKRSLSNHIMTHSRVKLYKCDMCNESFASPSSFHKHVLVHSVKSHDLKNHLRTRLSSIVAGDKANLTPKEKA